MLDLRNSDISTIMTSLVIMKHAFMHGAYFWCDSLLGLLKTSLPLSPHGIGKLGMTNFNTSHAISTAYTNGQCFDDIRRSTWSLVLSFRIINFDAEIIILIH